MKKRTLLTVAFITVLLLLTAVATQFVNLGQADPYMLGSEKEGEIPAPEGTLPPTILILSPENDTAYASHTVSLTVNVAIPESNGVTLHISEIYYVASWLQAGKQRVDIGLGSFNLTGLPAGSNWVVVYAVATGFAYDTHDKIQGVYHIYYYVDYRIASASLVNFIVDPIAPSILSLSVENKTYSTSNVPLDVLVNEPVSQVVYSLDGQGNMTVPGNMTLIGLSDGGHELTVWVRDFAGNAGNSETVYFSVDAPKPFSTTLVSASAASVAVVCVGLLIYFKKRRATSGGKP